MGPNSLQSRWNPTKSGTPAMFCILTHRTWRCKKMHRKAPKTRFLSKSLSKSLFRFSDSGAEHSLTVALSTSHHIIRWKQEQMPIPDQVGVFFLGLPFGQPPFLAFRRAAAALARLVARPACAARTLPMSAPQWGHFTLLIRGQYRRCARLRHVRLRRIKGAAGSLLIPTPLKLTLDKTMRLR